MKDLKASKVLKVLNFSGAGEARTFAEVNGLPTKIRQQVSRRYHAWIAESPHIRGMIALHRTMDDIEAGERNAG